MDFSKFIKNLPDAPGIYMFYDKTAALIYVGKATSLRNRVRSYFNPHHSPSLTSGRSGVGLRPIVQMMHRVADIRFVQTDSVLEAIILEANHIKKYQPIYNVDGKDDKSWNYIGITRDEYPRVVTIREHELDRLKHESIKTLKQWGYVFGPYPGMNTKATMKILRRLFRFSSCVPGAERPCVYYQMGQCLGVCVGEIFSAEYKKRVIQPLTLFLRGKKKLLVKNLEIRMKKLAKAQEYEDAAGLRDQIDRLQHIQDVALLNKSFVEDESRFTIYAYRRL